MAACFSQWRTAKTNDLELRLDEEMLETVGDPHWHGTIIKRDDDKHFVLAPVLVPGQPDLQGDVITAEEIEKAAHTFLSEIRDRDDDTDIMHRIEVKKEDVAIAESWVAPINMEINDHEISKGTWMLGLTIKKDTIWNMVKDGILNGLSIFGIGKRTPVENLAEPH